MFYHGRVFVSLLFDKNHGGSGGLAGAFPRPDFEFIKLRTACAFFPAALRPPAVISVQLIVKFDFVKPDLAQKKREYVSLCEILLKIDLVEVCRKDNLNELRARSLNAFVGFDCIISRAGCVYSICTFVEVRYGTPCGFKWTDVLCIQCSYNIEMNARVRTCMLIVNEFVSFVMRCEEWFCL